MLVNDQRGTKNFFNEETSTRLEIFCLIKNNRFLSSQKFDLSEKNVHENVKTKIKSKFIIEQLRSLKLLLQLFTQSLIFV